MEPVAAKNVGTGNFVIGTMNSKTAGPSSDGKPSGLQAQSKDEFLVHGVQSWGDDKTHKSSATVEYDVWNAASNKPSSHGRINEQMGM